jgi:predicted kinase
MLIGIPGSGKSTWLKTQKLEDPACLSICPDEIRIWLTGNISDQSQNDSVWKIAQYTTNWSLENKQDVILDATNVNTSLRRLFLSKLPPNNIKRQALIFEVAPDEAIKRIRHDLKNISRSNVPDEVIYRMHGEFVYTMKAIKEENWDQIIINPNSSYGRSNA